MKKQGLLIISLIFFSFLSIAQAPTISLQPVASGFSNPVDIRHCNDSRLFIVEQDGIIKIIDNGTVLPTPFLDIDSIVGSSGNEEGLLGLAFHPEYKTNGYFFVYYTNNAGNIQVSRFNVSAADSNVADASSQLPLLTIPHPSFSNHNGGSLHFGPDGYLYFGTGDGGSGGDPSNRAQNLMDRLGKIHRIDVNTGTPYGIPSDNPFVNNVNAFPEIWSFGLRNPWRMSFDRMTGDLWIGDVGQNAWEEVDMEPAGSQGGVNYGWRCYEGLHPYNTAGCQPQSTYQDPVFEMSHGNPGNYCSITGGYVYRGVTYGDMYGCYFFSDYCNDMIQVLRSDGAGGFNHYNTINFPGAGISAFGEDQYGDIYIADLFSGEIVKITSTVCAPAASFSENDTLYICADSVLLQVPFGPNHAYNWQTPSGGAGGNSVWVTEDGWVTLTVANVISTCSASDSAYVVLYGEPAQASMTGLDSIYCILPGNADTLTGFPAGGIFTGAGITGNVFDPFTLSPGVHSVHYQYTDSNNCSSSVSQDIIAEICIGLPEMKDNSVRILGQNPLAGSLDLIFISQKDGEVLYQIADLSGRLISDGKLSLVRGNQNATLEFQGEEGIYFLTAVMDNTIITYRFVWLGNR